jgi:hypothetical protein
MSLWQKCHGADREAKQPAGVQTTRRSSNNPPEFKQPAGVQTTRRSSNNPPEFRDRNNSPTRRSSVETNRTIPAALLRTLLRAVVVPLAKRLKVVRVVK